MSTARDRARDHWLARLAAEDEETRRSFARGCAQWMDHLLPWGGQRPASYPVSHVLDGMWSDPLPEKDWEGLATWVMEQVPRPGDAAETGWLELVAGYAAAGVADACLTMGSPTREALGRSLRTVLDLLEAGLRRARYADGVGDGLDTASHDRHAYTYYMGVLDDIWQARASDLRLSAAAHRWRNTPELVAGWRRYTELTGDQTSTVSHSSAVPTTAVTRVRDSWSARLGVEDEETQRSFMRACAQWMGALLPWEGRDLTPLAREALDAMWADPVPDRDWGRLFDRVVVQIPHEDDVPEFSWWDFVFECAMAGVAYACLGVRGPTEEVLGGSLALVEDLLDCGLQDAGCPSTEVEDEECARHCAMVLDDIWRFRDSREELVASVVRWRSRPELVAGWQRYARLSSATTLDSTGRMTTLSARSGEWAWSFRLTHLADEGAEAQRSFVRACAQWLCSLLPWDGHDLTPLARSTLEDLWASPAVERDWLEAFLLLRQEAAQPSPASQEPPDGLSGPTDPATPAERVGTDLAGLVADYAAGAAAMACLAAWGPTPEDVSASIAGLVVVLEAGTYHARRADAARKDPGTTGGTTDSTTDGGPSAAGAARGTDAGSASVTTGDAVALHHRYSELMREIRDAQDSREELAASATRWRDQHGAPPGPAR